MLSDPSTKACRTCKIAKPVTEFYLQPASDKPRPDCKPCHRAARRQRYAEANGVDESYDQLLRREYGITLDEYNELLRKQAHRCGICRRAETVKMQTGRTKRLAVDHDHVTGKVRALLCQRCNILVWALEDNHVTIDAIAAYIETWRSTFVGVEA